MSPTLNFETQKIYVRISMRTPLFRQTLRSNSLSPHVNDINFLFLNVPIQQNDDHTLCFIFNQILSLVSLENFANYFLVQFS